MNAQLEAWTGLWLVDPAVAFAAAAVAAFAAFGGRLGRGRRPAHVAIGAWRALARDADGRALPRGPRVVAAALANGPLPAFGLVLLAFACGRPVERVPQPLDERGIDAVLCIDVSSSMAARDLGDGRSRLDVAVRAATRFALARESDRLALVRFARFGELVVPPTNDTAAVAESLGRLETVAADGDQDATGIGLALARATELLADRASTARVVVLLTDGMENVALGAGDEIGPLAAARLAARRGVRVHAIVIGPRGDAESNDDASAAAVASTGDLAELRAVAEHTGGRLFEAPDAGAVTAAWAAVDEMERVALAVPRFVFRERFAPFLAIGLACLAGAWLARRAGLEVLP